MDALTNRDGLHRTITGYLLLGLLLLTVGSPMARAARGSEVEIPREGSVEPPIRKVERARDMEVIEQQLEREAIREHLRYLGFSVEEIKTRLDRLSDEQIHSMANRIRSVKAGGHADFPEAPDHPILLIVFIILLPLVAVIWLVLSLFHRHEHADDFTADRRGPSPAGAKR